MLHEVDIVNRPKPSLWLWDALHLDHHLRGRRITTSWYAVVNIERPLTAIDRCRKYHPAIYPIRVLERKVYGKIPDILAFKRLVDPNGDLILSDIHGAITTIFKPDGTFLINDAFLPLPLLSSMLVKLFRYTEFTNLKIVRTSFSVEVPPTEWNFYNIGSGKPVPHRTLKLPNSTCIAFPSGNVIITGKHLEPEDIRDIMVSVNKILRNQWPES